jgi:hypothetical protein
MKTSKPSIKWIVYPLLFAFIILAIFGFDAFSEWLSVMTLGFIFLVPFAVGFLTVYFSKQERAEKVLYAWFAPWVPILLFFALTLVLSLEGWACWLMVLPIFLIFSSIGGLVASARRSRKRKQDNDRLLVSVIAILPLVVAPLEQWVGASSETYKAYTSIDLEAPKAVIWSHVTRVSEIAKEEDKGWLTRNLGFPRPIKAELDYEGVGAYRAAIFSKGLVFHEEVKEYTHQQRMVFSIKANPYDIPSATLDKHVVIGGEFFDVLNGTYELEHLQGNQYRLHLYSHFKLNTTFNFYASLWARWIMKDIQQNILQVIKGRVEPAVKK